MAIPSRSYIKLKGGTDASNSTIYTGSLIKIGDNIKVTGTANNNSIFHVADITTQGSDVYYVLEGTGIISESSSGNLSIEVVRAPGDKLCALGDVDSQGGVDIWSDNATTDYTSKDNGWESSAISPTLNGDDAKYIYHFVDEALRVCNINEQNSSIIKWYGYIQRRQFNNTNGLIFSEWQEHPNNLQRPRVATSFTYAYGHTTHDGSNAATSFYQNNRGVAIKKKDSVSNLEIDGSHNATTTSFLFKNSDGDSVQDRALTGEVITIDEDLGVSPKEFLFCKKESGASGGAITYSRFYGGAGSLGEADTYANQDIPIIERGTGFNIGLTGVASGGDWEKGVYEFYQTFIYDGNQESLPSKIGNGAATIAAFTHSCEGQEAFKISVYADLAYNGRVSGGRIYTRLNESNDDLILLVDIDIVKGVRTTLDGDYKDWVYEAGDGFYVEGENTGDSLKPNLDTYTTLNGFSPDNTFTSIGRIGEMYKASTIANRRTFIANVKTRGLSGEVQKFGDRIMFSEIGKYDTYLESNFIDVSKGDFGEYVALESYADRLLAYKHNLIHIINISSPSISNWYLEDTLKNIGVSHSFSVVKTNNGIAWVSDEGCYLYNGSEVRNLINKKITVSDSSYSGATSAVWNRWYRGNAQVKDVMIGFDPISNSLIMFKSPNDSANQSNHSFIYDFDTDAWVFESSVFADSGYYTNFITDWNNNLALGVYDGSSDVEFKKFLPISISKDDQQFVTRDIDFGAPGLIKKIYALYVTYKSDGAETTPFKYAIDGKQSFGSSGGGTFNGNFESTSAWDIVELTPSSIISCQSLQIKFEPPSSGIFEINDISIKYRVIRNKNVS